LKAEAEAQRWKKISERVGKHFVATTTTSAAAAAASAAASAAVVANDSVGGGDGADTTTTEASAAMSASVAAAAAAASSASNVNDLVGGLRLPSAAQTKGVDSDVMIKQVGVVFLRLLVSLITV
jgi:hypothetical protein